MAKKRRLSKRDRKIKARMNETERLKLLLDDEKFNRKLSSAIKKIDKTCTGQLVMIGNVLRYYFFDEDEFPCAYDVAVATGEGIFIWGKKYTEKKKAV